MTVAVDGLIGAPDPPRLGLRGVEVVVPDGWECRIRLGGKLEESEALFPVLHAATIPLPSERADFGGGVVERLGGGDVFVSLIEFGPETVGTALFSGVDELPLIDPSMFHPSQLQRSIPGQAGKQFFFTYRDRSFCLYVVIGAYGRRVELSERANALVSAVTVDMP